MADTNIYQTPRALAEDVLLLLRAGGPLTDDENLDERQVLYWIAGFVAEKYRAVLSGSRGIMAAVDNNLWQPICLTMTEGADTSLPRTKLPALRGCAVLPAGILSVGMSVMLKEVYWGSRKLSPMPIDTVRQASAGYSRFGVPQFGYAIVGPNLYAALPVGEDANQPVSALAVLSPDTNRIVDSPDEPILWPSDWTPEIRRQCMTLLGVIQQTAPDQVNNGADKKSDDR